MSIFDIKNLKEDDTQSEMRKMNETESDLDLLFL